ncbi:WGR domain-containing protein (plasmid) [Microvirga sp. VF16]|nr:WGR domain-containing protein [Microvirga sp. VF16]
MVNDGIASRPPIKHHLVLHRINPEQGVRRFYSLMIERDLFGTIRLVSNWGRISLRPALLQ